MDVPFDTKKRCPGRRVGSSVINEHALCAVTRGRKNRITHNNVSTARVIRIVGEEANAGSICRRGDDRLVKRHIAAIGIHAVSLPELP